TVPPLVRLGAVLPADPVAGRPADRAIVRCPSVSASALPALRQGRKGNGVNRHNGPYGSAEEFEMPDVPHASETVCQWLVNSPIWHPAWSQYMIVVIRLREGVPWRPESPQ